MKPIDFAFRPVDPFCASFIELLSPKSTSLSQALVELDASIVMLDAVFSFFIKKSEEDFPIYTFSLPTPEINADGIHKYLLYRLKKLQKKYNSVKGDYYAKAATYAADLCMFAKDCKSREYAVIIKQDEFIEKIEKGFPKEPLIQKLTKKIQALDRYAMCTFHLIKYPNRTIVHIKEELPMYEYLVDEDLEYASASDFDDHFLCYIANLNKLADIDNYIMKITEGFEIKASVKHFTDGKLPKISKRKMALFGLDLLMDEELEIGTMGRFSLASFSELARTFFDLVKPENIKQQYLLHSSLLRIVFDRIINFFPRFLSFQPNAHVFIEKTGLIRISTPTALNVPHNLIPQAQMATPFLAIKANSPVVAEACAIFSNLQFITSPIDCLVGILRGLKKLELFASQGSQSKLSFDDVFSIFVPAFCISPPANAAAIVNAVDHVDGLPLSSAMDYSRTLLLSAVDFALHFNEADGSKPSLSDDFDIEDPLGVIKK